jgi:hypothetical protein
MKKLFLLSVLAVIFGCGSASAGLILCYAGNAACADEAAWTAQVSAANRQISAIDTFTNAPLLTTGITQVGGTHGYVCTSGVGCNIGQWRDSVIDNPTASGGNQPLQTTTFSYVNPAPVSVWGFGANFDTLPGHGGHASGVTITINGDEIINLRFYTGGFFGLYFTDPGEKFTSFTLGTQPACWDYSQACTGWEIFDMDNLRFALDARITHMPEPATFGALGVALVIVGILRRRAIDRG